jgi:hypothetical protein
MKDFLTIGNRRKFLKLSGTITFGLIGANLVSWASPGWEDTQNELPGFNPAKADLKQVETWTQVAVKSANAVLAGTARFTDFETLSSTYRDFLLYLNKLGFDEAGARYLEDHKPLPPAPADSLTMWYEKVKAAGLKVERSQWDEMVDKKSRNPEYLDAVLTFLRKRQAVQFHQSVAEAILSGGKESPATRAEKSRFVLAGYQELRRAKFSEHTCTYLDWGGAYLGVVALPIGATPVGAALGVFVISLWAIAKIGGC